MKTSHTLLLAVLCFGASVSLRAQTISYILPDIGAPGMNTYVEIVAPVTDTSAFGPDGIYYNNTGSRVRVVCDDPADTAMVTIGPVVVSWHGRLVATQIFVKPGIDPGTSDWQTVDSAYIVPIRVLVNGKLSNREFFYILRPQPAILATGGGTLGDGTLGRRSRRGAMIVDSMVLGAGTFAISTNDMDPVTPGNQGYLPFVLISRGRVSGTPTTTISASATGKNGGPGGGGGGGNFCDASGSGSDGGAGFTGGGRGGRNGSSVTSDEYRNPGVSTGPIVSATGTSLNGVSGGTAPWYEASGGGTGHPFGSSGIGCDNGPGCTPAGGFGGGSGQQQQLGGGGGGYATAGASSNAGNGGQLHGNRQLVPLAGGSGGASGNPQGAFVCSGEGGGGGGAIRISAPEIFTLAVTANGGDGQDRSNGPGGAGSGGGISVEAKMMYATGQMTSAGSQSGIDGGQGRMRIDGPRNSIALSPANASNFRGPSTDTSSLVARSFTLTGTGNGEEMIVLLKSEHMPWTPIDTVRAYFSNFWTSTIRLPLNDELFYLAVIQRAISPSSGQWTDEPHGVMSQAAANILRILTVPLISVPARRNYRLICETEWTDSVAVANAGEAPLVLQAPAFARGGQGFALVAPTAFPVVVPPGKTEYFVIRYSPVPGVMGTALDTLIVPNNDTSRSYNPWRLALEGTKDSSWLAASSVRMDFGSVSFCTPGGIDTVVTVRNTGTVPMLLALPQTGSADFTITDPPAVQFPYPLAPGAAVPLRIHFDPVVPGSPSNGTLHLASDADGCLRTVDIVLSGIGHSVALRWTDAIDFTALACPGDLRDTTIILENTGTAPLTFISAPAANPDFTILAPAFPFTMPGGGQQPLLIRYAPANAGVHNVRFDFPVQPCAMVKSLALTGRRDSVGLSAAALDFGVLRTSQFPTTMDLTVHNTGAVPVDVTAASLGFGTWFDIVRFTPAVLQPGDSLVVTLRFRQPDRDGSFGDKLSFDGVPLCSPFIVDILGRRVAAAATLWIDTLRAAPGELVFMAIHLSANQSPLLYGVDRVEMQLRFNKHLLEPMFFLPASNHRIEGDDRIIKLTETIWSRDPEEDYFSPHTWTFRAMLGPVDATSITIDSAESIGGGLDLTRRNGAFFLTICREGGARLVDASIKAGIRAVHPNPFNPATEIEYAVIEEGVTQLQVVDMLGRIVAVLDDGVRVPGLYTARFDASSLPTGAYTCVLITPSGIHTRAMLLAK